MEFNPIFNNNGMVVGHQFAGGVFDNAGIRVGDMFGNRIILDNQPDRNLKLYDNHLDVLSGSRFDPFEKPRKY